MKDTVSLTTPPPPAQRGRGGPKQTHGDTYDCAPFGNPLLRNMFHGNLRQHTKKTQKRKHQRNTSRVSRNLQRWRPALMAAHGGSKRSPPPPPPVPRPYRCAIRDAAAGVHCPESPASEHGSHLVNLLEWLLFHFDCKKKGANTNELKADITQNKQ